MPRGHGQKSVSCSSFKLIPSLLFAIPAQPAWPEIDGNNRVQRVAGDKSIKIKIQGSKTLTAGAIQIWIWQPNEKSKILIMITSMAIWVFNPGVIHHSWVAACHCPSGFHHHLQGFVSVALCSCSSRPGGSMGETLCMEVITPVIKPRIWFLPFSLRV